MTKYADLIHALRDCSDQSTSELSVLSSILRNRIEVLDGYKINYEDQAEGILIDLTAQSIKIFKSKRSAVKYLKENDFLSDIIVIEENSGNTECRDIEYVYESQPHSCSCFFENSEYYFKFKQLFLDTGVVSYHDEALNRLILLSNKHGRLHVACNNEWSEAFYNNDNDIKRQYYELEKKISLNNDYEDFFKESLIEYAKSISEENMRLAGSLKNIRHIVESASRNYELFKHNFSFSEFKKELDEDKERYLKDYQSSLSDFLSKVASMPIQFGVYIFLMVRFSEELLPIVATSIIIVFWSVFKVITVNRILDNVEHLKSKYQGDLDQLLEKSGINETEVRLDREQVDEKFKKSIALIKSYRVFVTVFSICALFICVQFIMKILF